MKKKYGILTFHRADNLGAVLQAYALQSALDEECGVYAEMIDYRCEAIEATNGVAGSREDWKNKFKALPRSLYYLIKHSGFQKFRKQYLRCSKQYTSQTIGSANLEYTAFITGSDQVWNRKCSGNDDVYFLDFVSSGMGKFAYAASMGNYAFPADMYQHYSRLLMQFNRISVREYKAVKELKRLGIRDVKVCPDPVVLLAKERWGRIIPDALCKQRYVLVYQILPDNGLRACAEKYARRHKCKVIHNKRSLAFILHNSPGEFLSWIYHAECVFTNSFHGTVLSLIFNKPLAADVKLIDGSVNERIRNILQQTDAEWCELAEGKDEYYPANARQAIEQMRAEGLDYLRMICEKT